MRLLNTDELKMVHDKIRPQLLKLYKHETERRICNVFQIGFPLGLCYIQLTCNGEIYVLRNNKFCNVIEDYNKKFLEKSIDKSTPISIYTSLSPYCEDWYKSLYGIDDYSFFTEEGCAYVIPVQSIQNNEEPLKILRIDLFRMISRDRKDFTGGLFHVLQHFSIDKENLSYRNDKLDVFDIQHIVYLIASAFAGHLEKDGKDKDTYLGHLPYKDKVLKAVFYLESDSCVYFVKSLHIQ